MDMLKEYVGPSMLQEWLSVVPSDVIRIVFGAALAFFALGVIRFLLGIVNFIWVYFLRPSKNLKRVGGPWAVVTGATDGIGRAYSEALARKGLNLVLVSRTQSRLDEVASEITSTYGVEVRTLAADLTKLNSTEALAPFAEALEGLDVGVLINNAGMSYGYPEYLEEIDTSMDVDLITINAIAPTLLTKLIIKGMKSRRRGFIVNIGSAHGRLPGGPLLATYASTKSFINQFSRSMDCEARPFGVRIQDQCPFFVATKMAKIRMPRLDAPSPKVWARSAVRQIGYETVRTPYWFHGFMAVLVDNYLPSNLVLMYIHWSHSIIRRAGLRKRARRAKEQAASQSAESENKKSI